jgi:hypothetical protein
MTPQALHFRGAWLEACARAEEAQRERDRAVESCDLYQRRLAEAEARIAELEALAEALEREADMLTQWHETQRDLLREADARIAELEGEARVLIGCPCWCHGGDGPKPHRDCRECVRKTSTPTGIDRDHTEALWREKWMAALDLMGSQAERADEAEASLAALVAAVEAEYGEQPGVEAMVRAKEVLRGGRGWYAEAAGPTDAPESEQLVKAAARITRIIEAGEALDAHSFHGMYRCSEIEGVCPCGLSDARAKWEEAKRG